MNNICKAANNRYIIVGNQLDITTNSRIEVDQVYFYVFNSKLDSITSKKYIDTVVSRYPNSIMTDKQRNILVTGNISSSTIHYNASDNSWYHDSSFTWLAKYDRNANLIWEKHFTNYLPENAYGTKVILGHDSNSYLLASVDYNFADNLSETLITKLDTSGKRIWSTFISTPYQSWIYNGNDLVALKNGGYAFISTYATQPPVSGIPYYNNYHYGKINESGSILWQKHFSYNDSETVGQRILETNDGDLLLFGMISFATSNVTRTDSNGNIRWYRDYLHVNDYLLTQQLVNISYTPHHQILMSGALSDVNPLAGVFDTVGSISWFVLTDSLGCLAGGCQVYDTMWHTGVSSVSPLESVSVYPNPFVDELTVAQAPVGSYVTITDILGRELYRASITNSKQLLSLPSLSPGMYYVVIQEGDHKRVFKLVRQ